MKLYYATSNPGKFAEVKAFIEKHSNIELIQFNQDIPEIQTLDQYQIALDKAQKAWNILKQPVIVDDAGIYFDQYNNFPGVMTKFIHQSLGFEGILKLVEKNNKAYRQLTMVYIDENGPKHFISKCMGSVVPSRSTNYPQTLPWNAIFLPEGSSKTEAEMEGTREKEVYNYRVKAVKQFIDWYSNEKTNS